MNILFKVFILNIWIWLSLGTLAYAQASDSYSFMATPLSISGPAGSTIGWGYTITNKSPTHWLLGFDVHFSNAFLHGKATSIPFNFPVLAPGASLSFPYDGDKGLANLSWDTDAPVGFTNSGDFMLTSYFYDNDPSLGGNQVGSPITQKAPYLAIVNSPTAIRRSSSKIFVGIFVIGICGLIFWAWKRLHRNIP